jgi:hypothetical protein
MVNKIGSGEESAFSHQQKGSMPVLSKACTERSRSVEGLVLRLLIVALLIPAFPIFSATPEPPGIQSPSPDVSNPFVSYSKGRLTVRAVDVPVKDLIEEIRKKSGIIIELRNQKAAQKRVTVNLADLSPEQAVEDMLRGLSFALFYDGDRLSQVVVLSADGSPPQLSLSRASSARPAPRPSPAASKPSPADSVPDFEELLERDRDKGLKAVKEALANPDSEIKTAALEALADTEGEDVLPLLSGALRDPDPSFRMEVLEALADKGELQLVRSALSDQNTEVREKAAELLKIEEEGK